MSVTVVSGVPGVGSSRVCEAARRELGDGYELINYGDVMLEEAVSRGIVAERDELGGLPVSEYRLLQQRAGEYIGRRAREADLIVDTHFVVHTAHGFLPGFPEPVLREVRPDRLVLVEADPETILDRRIDSHTRDYPTESKTSVRFHQHLNRAAATTYAMHVGAPIRPVRNESDIETAATALVEVVAGADE